MLVYANKLALPPDSGSPDQILAAIDSWLQFKTRKALSASQLINQPGRRLRDGKELEVVVGGEKSKGEPVLGCVVFSHPDLRVSGRKWFTRVGFRVPVGDAPSEVSVVLETSDISVQSGSAPVFATRPGVINSLVLKCGLIAPSPAATIEDLTPADAGPLADDVDRADRQYAIIIISREPFSERYYAAPEQVLWQVVGLARVLVIQNKAHTKEITTILGRRLSAWGGAVNVIMPPFRGGFVPNTLLDPESLRYETGRDKSPADYVLYLLTQRLNLPHYRQEITPAAVKQHILSLRLASLKGQQENIAQLRERISLLEQNEVQWQEKLDRVNLEKDQAYAAWEEAEERAGAAQKLRDQVQTYRKAIETYKQEGRVDALPITTVAEAMDDAESRFAHRIAFALNSKSDGKDSPFADARDVLIAFEWLATTYWDSKTGKQPCQDLDKSLADKVSGWHYSAHQSNATMKANKEWYQCPWEGAPNGKLWIPEHLKGGAARSRRPEETIRIAFAWEPTVKKVVIGFIGQHQENTKS